ncbi:MAG: ceramide glucosyltransferase [Roseiarcus sp.]
MTLSGVAAGIAASGLLIHAASALLAADRCRRSKPATPRNPNPPPVTIVQPLRGVESFSRETLASIFALDYPDYEIVFCVADGADPIAPLVRGFIAANPRVPARLLIGDDRVSGNPKLNNVVKGWRAARHDWIVIADSNVLMPKDYIHRLLARWRDDTGIVCSPPIGSEPKNFAAEIECAFLNTYQARWQYAGERAGYGFAQGKTMLWRRDVLEAGGGIEALGVEIAEDAASTKLVHRLDLRAHLTDRPFAQPLGQRDFADVWKRQLRWARLRRVTFAIYYTPELLTSSAIYLVAAALAGPEFDVSSLATLAVVAGLWYGIEAALALVAGWPLSWRTPIAWIARDLLLPWLWIQGWAGDSCEWRGYAMNVADETLAEVGRR